MEWNDYELIDTGGFEKLERFGAHTLSRPEPQAIWPKTLSQADWDSLADAVFRRDARDSERGQWALKPEMPEQWWMSYSYRDMRLKLRLGLTSFKHVGVFPEQKGNWEWIYDAVTSLPEGARVLNLFAYTGAASLAARAAGAEVTHVDAVRQVINWSRENMEASGLTDIRWMIDDALKFARREVRRGRSYSLIVLDPPAYGRGPDGEKWVLEAGMGELMEHCARLLAPRQSFLLLNLYSMGYSPLIAENLAKAYFPAMTGVSGELSIADRSGKRLPLGVFYRGKIV